MFTWFDEQVIDLLDTIWEIDRGIYYEIVEDLLKSQEYASEHNGNESSEVSIANANNLKEVIALLTKKCPSPKALRGIAQVSMDIKESEEIFAQWVDFESKEDEDITKLKKYVSEENKHFGKVSPEDLEFNQWIFGDEEL